MDGQVLILKISNKLYFKTSLGEGVKILAH
jgi:hypothetical protein